MQGRTIPGVVVQVAAKTVITAGGVALGSAACAGVAATVVGAVACPALIGAGLVGGSIAADVAGTFLGGFTDQVVRKFWP